MNITTAMISNAAASSTSMQPALPAAGNRMATPFGGILKDAIEQVGNLEDQAHSAAVDLMTGKGVDVHQAVIAAQKADMAFELTISVRNKAVQAYQSVMGMQF